MISRTIVQILSEFSRRGSVGDCQSKRDLISYFRTPCLTLAATATATRNQSRNSPVSAADDRVAPKRNRRDSQLARRAPNARSALPAARDPSTAIIQSPMRGPTSQTATPFPRINPSAKDRISRYVNSSCARARAEGRAREFDYAVSIEIPLCIRELKRSPLPSP